MRVEGQELLVLLAVSCSSSTASQRTGALAEHSTYSLYLINTLTASPPSSHPLAPVPRLSLVCQLARTPRCTHRYKDACSEPNLPSKCCATADRHCTQRSSSTPLSRPPSVFPPLPRPSPSRHTHPFSPCPLTSSPPSQGAHSRTCTAQRRRVPCSSAISTRRSAVGACLERLLRTECSRPLEREQAAEGDRAACHPDSAFLFFCSFPRSCVSTNCYSSFAAHQALRLSVRRPLRVPHFGAHDEKPRRRPRSTGFPCITRFRRRRSRGRLPRSKSLVRDRSGNRAPR